MNVAVLSGKGGAGKTTVAVNLAWLMHWNYIDVDVEAPNGHIFLKPHINKRDTVNTLVPVVDEDKCKLCKSCVKACAFNALMISAGRLQVFQELCHGCGACVLSCTHDAITEVERPIGIFEHGQFNYEQNGSQGEFLSGLLNINEPMAGPVIHSVTQMISSDEINIIDCSPGASCNVVKALKIADFAVLVTEPTAFGLHDLDIAGALVKTMNIPSGVVINRSKPEYDHKIVNYIETQNLPLLGRVPYSRKAAELYSEGRLLVEDVKYHAIFGAIGRILSAHLNRTDKSLHKIRKDQL